MSKKHDKIDVLLPIQDCPKHGMEGLRFRQDEDGNRSVEAGAFKPVKDGDVIEGDLVRLQKREGDDGYNVTTMIEGPSSSRSRPSTKAYREGWDRIFGRSDEELPN